MTEYLFSVIYRLLLDSQTRLDILGFSGLSATSPSGTKHFIFPPTLWSFRLLSPVITLSIGVLDDVEMIVVGRGSGVSASLSESEGVSWSQILAGLHI